MKIRLITVMILAGILITVFATNANRLLGTATSTTPQPVTHANTEDLLGVTPQPDGRLCPDYPMLEDTSTFEEFIAEPPTASGFGYSVNYDEIPELTQIGVNTYQIEADTDFTGMLDVYYGAGPSDPQEVDVRYILLINGQQYPLRDDKLYEDITLLAGQPTTLPIAIPPLESGTHDIIVIGLVNWVLNATGDQQILAHRSTLIVGDEYLPSERTYHRLQPAVTKSENPGFFTLRLHTQESLLIWVYPDIYKQVEGTLDFFISAGYMEGETRLRDAGITPQPMTTAFVGIIDGQQVPLSTEGDTFYIEITPDNTYSFIPVSIDSSGYSGQQELTILRIDHPQIPQCWLYGTGFSYSFSFSVSSSRVGVDFGE